MHKKSLGYNRQSFGDNSNVTNFCRPRFKPMGAEKYLFVPYLITKPSDILVQDYSNINLNDRSQRKNVVAYHKQFWH